MSARLRALEQLFSRGNCPLGPLFRRLGDEKPLFELVLPRRAAKLAIPLLTSITSVGAVLLVVRVLAQVSLGSAPKLDRTVFRCYVPADG